MRFIIHELPYEQPLAAGQLRYAENGVATGALEAWRLTAAVDGYHILRVDLDARAAASGHSYLYHLVLNPYGQPEQLKFRFWGSDLDVNGQVVLEETAVIATREVNGRRYETVLNIAPNYRFWFPACMGLGLLAGNKNSDVVTAVSLRSAPSDAASAFRLFTTQVRLEAGSSEKLTLLDQVYTTRPLTIRWDREIRRLWLDDNNRPLKMERGDGLTAVAIRHIQYPRIKAPGG